MRILQTREFLVSTQKLADEKSAYQRARDVFSHKCWKVRCALNALRGMELVRNGFESTSVRCGEGLLSRFLKAWRAQSFSRANALALRV
ncbi:hypothetical protein D6817_05825 [Candidatus Pacearchaeota archaeon]|nr:MAG: hypothetical protein D6817_05825 [Candidatus Pacearchaeota archaeon]